MKKTLILTAAMLGLSAQAAIHPFQVSLGSRYLDAPAEAVFCEAWSTSNATGTVTVKTVTYASVQGTKDVVETNVNWLVSYTNVPHQVAYLDGARLYDEDGTAAAISFTTNSVDDVTNIVATLTVNGSPIAVVTNAYDAMIVQTYNPTRTVTPITNVITTAVTTWTRTSTTNDLCTITLSGGKGTNVFQNVFLKGGTDIVGSGDGFTGGGAVIYLKRNDD